MDTPTRKPGLVPLIITILCYCVISISIVYYNNWFFKGRFKYPVFVSWWQQIFGVLGCVIGSFLASFIPGLNKAFPINRMEGSVVKKVWPLATAFVLFVAASNLCLMYTLVSTYLVARSLTLLFVLFLSYTMLHKRENQWVIISCILMTVGFIINALDPSTLSFLGLFYGAVASFFQAIYNVNIKRFLPHVGDDSQKLLFYNMGLSTFLFIPVVLLIEGMAPFKVVLGFADGEPWRLWLGILISGMLSTSMNMFQYLMIRLTNPVASNIVGLTKSVIQTLGGIIFLKERVTGNSIGGIGLTLFGSGMYCTTKSLEHVRNNDPKKEVDAKESFDNAESTNMPNASKNQVTV